MRSSGRPPPPLLGPRLRDLRKRRRLSIQELADSAGTSASAIHRYESGWGRFEVETLRRLAEALGACLEIRLETPPQPPADTTKHLVRRLRPLFWDVQLTQEHLRDHPLWVLRRVLQYGDREVVRQARLYYGDEAVLQAARHRSMDPRTRRLWEVVLAEKESA